MSDETRMTLTPSDPAAALRELRRKAASQPRSDPEAGAVRPDKIGWLCPLGMRECPGEMCHTYAKCREVWDGQR